jgi:hypothetical protein
MIFGRSSAQHQVVVVFGPQLYEGQWRGLDQAVSRSLSGSAGDEPVPGPTVAAAKRQLDKIHRLAIRSKHEANWTASPSIVGGLHSDV